jgi:hypothetical protein
VGGDVDVWTEPDTGYPLKMTTDGQSVLFSEFTSKPEDGASIPLKLALSLSLSLSLGSPALSLAQH